MARDSRITNIVDTREVWIIFAVNPDGAEFDIKDGTYHLWRKNRQPNAGVTAIGTDLNRNYDYRWGCCGGSSKNPANLMYRGARPFSAPETRAVRDFVLSRVVDGWQQIRTHISFHTSGRLVMWPYGYTLTNVPGDMSRNDHAALVAMGKKMASLNGYTPEQGSDLYITSGRFGDWMYGTQRVFTYTFEMTHGWYPDDSEIAKETARNRSAILYLIEQADCPWRAAGLAAADCGAFYDDLELYHGWQANAQGTDTATDGTWQRGNPQPTSLHGPKQLGTTASASRALVTGLKAGSSAGANDVDGGLTSITSPAITLPATIGRLTFRYYLAHSNGSSSADALRAVVMADDGDHVVFTERGAANDDDAAWSQRLDRHRRLRRPDHPPALRGRRWRAWQPARGGRGRHPDPPPMTIGGIASLDSPWSNAPHGARWHQSVASCPSPGRSRGEVVSHEPGAIGR